MSNYIPKNKRHFNQVLLNIPTRKGREAPVVLRRALLEMGRECKCDKCGLVDKWQGEPILLEIHHIDGDWRNNEQSNLQFLCPNCHSQTPTFYRQAGKYFCKCGNKRGRTSKGCKLCKLQAQREDTLRPDKSILEALLWKIPTTAIGKQYGVCDKAVEKWCKIYGLDKPPRGYWTKRTNG